MSRRDTIIIAVVLNAFILVVLFMTAVKQDPEPTMAREGVLPSKERSQPEQQKQTAKASSNVDTIDDVLNKYSEVLATKESEPSKRKAERAAQSAPSTAKKEQDTPLPHELPEKTITVAKGDVLEKIARIHGVAVEDIMRVNHLSGSNLRIGQSLRIPKAQKKAPSKEKPPSKKGKFYVVKGGDNPWTIARKNNLNLEDLLRLNNISEDKAKKLRPGDRLRIE